MLILAPGCMRAVWANLARYVYKWSSEATGACLPVVSLDMLFSIEKVSQRIAGTPAIPNISLLRMQKGRAGKPQV